MLTCPQCKKGLPDRQPVCPRCRTDLGLLVDYVDHLEDGLAHARELTRRGELGQAVWAYLEVLEVDPDNAEARRQVGQVATAVRQFDRATPSRRWMSKMGRQARFRHWLYAAEEGTRNGGWILILLATFFLGLAVTLSFQFGRFLGPHVPAEAPPGQAAPEGEAPQAGKDGERDKAPPKKDRPSDRLTLPTQGLNR